MEISSWMRRVAGAGVGRSCFIIFWSTIRGYERGGAPWLDLGEAVLSIHGLLREGDETS